MQQSSNGSQNEIDDFSNRYFAPKNAFQNNQMAKFVLSNDKHEDHGILKALIFVTSYFFRSSHMRRKKISSVNKLRVDQLKSKKVMHKHGQSSTRRESEESSGGVLFLLGKLKIDVY